MESKFVSILREPDNVFGATELSPFRFEEADTKSSDVKYEYGNEDGENARVFDWESAYDGARVVLDWYN